MIERTEIPVGKKKIVIILLGGLILIAGGLWLALNPENFIPNIFRIRNPDVIRFWGIVGTLFFGLALAYGIKKLFDKRPGLIIDENGITPFSSVILFKNWSWLSVSE